MEWGWGDKEHGSQRYSLCDQEHPEIYSTTDHTHFLSPIPGTENLDSCKRNSSVDSPRVSNHISKTIMKIKIQGHNAVPFSTVPQALNGQQALGGTLVLE